jgi:hypothetical protein
MRLLCHATDVNGISSAYYLTQEFIDNSIEAFKRVQEFYKARGEKPPPHKPPHILLRHCFPQGDVSHELACIMVQDNACGMTLQQLLERLLTLGVHDAAAQVRRVAAATAFTHVNLLQVQLQQLLQCHAC